MFSINNTDKLVQVALICLNAQEWGAFHLGLAKGQYPGFCHPYHISIGLNQTSSDINKVTCVLLWFTVTTNEKGTITQPPKSPS